MYRLFVEGAPPKRAENEKQSRDSIRTRTIWALWARGNPNALFLYIVLNFKWILILIQLNDRVLWSGLFLGILNWWGGGIHKYLGGENRRKAQIYIKKTQIK